MPDFTSIAEPFGLQLIQLVQNRINLTARRTLGGMGPAPSGRQVDLVKCGTLKDDFTGVFNGTIRAVVAEDLTYLDYEGPCWLIDCNGDNLTVGDTYPAIRYGYHTIYGPGVSSCASSEDCGDTRPLYVTKQGSASSSGLRSGPCRILENAIGPDDLQSRILLDFGGYGYLADLQGPPGSGVPPDSGTWLWLVPYYQNAVFGTFDTGLTPGEAWSGFEQPVDTTGTVDTQDGGESGTESNIQTLTLPIFYCDWSPSRVVCTGDPENPTLLDGHS